MSRLGIKPLSIPSGVTVAINSDAIDIKGPKGELSFPIHETIEVSHADDTISVGRKSEDRIARAMHGTTRQLIQNMILGVTQGFTKELQIVGGFIKVIRPTNVTFNLRISYCKNNLSSKNNQFQTTPQMPNKMSLLFLHLL